MTDKLRSLDLFSGIGGFSLGLERTGGFETAAFCEIEDFPRRVLAKHWPEVPCYEDIRKLNAATLRRDGIEVDVLSAGFPCQDVSVAGRQAGIGPETRSGLWSECLRLVGELQPELAIFENVTNLLSGPTEQPGGWFSTILGDLAQAGYDAEWADIPASYIGAWHRRGRVWILAYPNKNSGQQGRAEKPILWQRHLSKQLTGAFARWPGRSGLPSPKTCGRNDGVPDVSHRIAALGNAVVPQIPELLGNAYLESINWRDAA